MGKGEAIKNRQQKGLPKRKIIEGNENNMCEDNKIDDFSETNHEDKDCLKNINEAEIKDVNKEFDELETKKSKELEEILKNLFEENFNILKTDIEKFQDKIDNLVKNNDEIKEKVTKSVNLNETLQREIKNLTEKNDSLKEKVKKFIEKNEIMQEEIKNLVEGNETLKQKVSNLIEINGNLEKILEILENSSLEMKKEVQNLGAINVNLQQKNEVLVKENGSLDGRVQTLEELSQKLKKELNEMIENKGRLESKVNELASEKKELEYKIKELINFKEKLEYQLKETNTSKEFLENEIQNLTEINKNILEEKKYSENKLRTIENYLFKYKILIEKMKKCQSLKNLIQNIKSEDENEEILKFVGIFGNGEDFLRDVYTEMKNYKMTEKIPLNNEELEFINYTNNFFKEKEESEDNVLIDVKINEDKFDKSIMQDILKPSDISFRIVEEFYVPGVKTKNYNFKAIVKGRK